MPPRRIGPARTDVTLRVDGEDVPARRGEPIAVALAASGRLVLGRSVKYHRPRGATCYAGRCDGCLMRVGGVSSRVTCRVAAEHGAEIETQNVLGSAEHDLLAATDWFFPGGMNHHEMFTWSKAANRAMQTIARRIAGIGELPGSVRAPVAPIERTCDVLVVGGGPTGLTAATHAARAGLDVVLADEEESVGGHLAYTPGAVRLREHDVAIGTRAAATRLAEDARAAGVTLLSRCSVLGVFSEREDAGEMPFIAIADAPDAPVRVRAKRLVVAQGRHEGAWAFEGNDLPGVIGSEAACRLLAHGVLCGERVVLAGTTSAASPGSARLRALASALSEAGAEILGPFELSAIVRARGRSGVSSCDVRAVDAPGQRAEVEALECDALVIAPPTSAVYELAEQAGAEVTWRDGGFEIVASAADGATSVAWARAIGRASGVASLPAGIAQASAAARAIAIELGAKNLAEVGA
jgi:sarcosine oxidase subunit alpha